MKDAQAILGYLIGTALFVACLMLLMALGSSAAKVDSCGWYTINCGE